MPISEDQQKAAHITQASKSAGYESDDSDDLEDLSINTSSKNHRRTDSRQPLIPIAVSSSVPPTVRPSIYSRSWTKIIDFIDSNLGFLLVVCASVRSGFQDFVLACSYRLHRYSSAL